MGLTNRFIKRSLSLNVVRVTDVDGRAIKQRDECELHAAARRFTTDIRVSGRVI